MHNIIIEAQIEMIGKMLILQLILIALNFSNRISNKNRFNIFINGIFIEILNLYFFIFSIIGISVIAFRQYSIGCPSLIYDCYKDSITIEFIIYKDILYFLIFFNFIYTMLITLLLITRKITKVLN